MPTIRFDQDLIMEKLFEFVSIHGFEELSARRLADFIGCSVMPIYSAYGNIGQLIQAARETIVQQMIDRMIVLGRDPQQGWPDKNELLGEAVAIASYARDNEHLYREVFIQHADRAHIERILERLKAIIFESNNTLSEELTPEELSIVLKKMWIAIQGVCAMICSGQIDQPTDVQIAEIFQETGSQILKGMLYDKGTLHQYAHYNPQVHATNWDLIGANDA